MSLVSLIRLPLDPIMTNEERYTLEEEQTSGWYTVGENVSKQRCKELYDSRLNEGVNPQRLRITRVA